jgi:hypothetical protein
MAKKGQWVVISQGSNANVGDVTVYGPYSSEEKAEAAKFEIRAEDGNFHEFHSQQLSLPGEDDADEG